MSEITTRRAESGSFMDLSAEERSGEKRKITPEQRKEEKEMVREYLVHDGEVRRCLEAYSERQRQLMQKHGLDYSSDDEKLKELFMKTTNALERQDELAPAMIRANLYRFDLEDIDVSTELEEQDSNRRIATLMEPQPLSNFCGLKFRTIGGRERIIDFFDLDRASHSILELIREEGVSKETFSGPYSTLLRTIFKYKQTSRFGENHGAAIYLWRVATRQLGKEHSGHYGFVY